MDSASIGMLISMIGLLILSGFFSATETAFSTFNRIRIKNMAQNGDKRAKLVIKFEDKYDKLINTILIGNNIVNIALSTISTLFFTNIIINNESLAATVSTIVVTIVVLIFGEISPKIIAKGNADKVALSFVKLLQFWLIILTPFSAVFGAWTKFMIKLFNKGEQSAYTEEELITIVDEAEEDGSIETEEGNLIRSAIEFTDVSAGDILTPRVDVCAISKDESIENIAKIFMENPYSRLPVYDEDMDDIVGILHEKDFFVAYHKNNKTITKYIQKPVHVSEHIKIADLLQVLKTKKCHMAIVVDEFGGTMGIVTMEDIIEELIGDVFDEHDEIEDNCYKEMPDGSYIVQCSADLDDFFEKFDLTYDDDEDMPQTLNGFVTKELETFPKVGDGFDYRNLHIEITKMGTKVVEEVKITIIQEGEKGAE